MVRISDILRRGRDEEEPRKDKAQQVQQEKEEKPPLPAQDKPKKEKPPKKAKRQSRKKTSSEPSAKDSSVEEKEPVASHVEIARVIMEKTRAGRPRSDEIYQELIALIKTVLDKAAKREPIRGRDILLRIDRAVDQMALAADELMALVSNSTPDNYLYAHSVNVSLLSIRLGLGLGYNKSRLSELGLAGFLCDIGMVKVLDITRQPRKLTPDEYEKVKEHPVYGTEILEKIKDLSKVVIYVTHQEHERINGSGYPRGLTMGDIDENARIVGLLDVYEALTHPRPHRKRLLPYEAIQEMIRNRDQFDHDLLKALIEEIGIYPIGSWVELNTGETAIVTSLNKGFPLQPTVNVIADSEGHKLKEAKSVELPAQAAIFIKRPLSESEPSK
ncbi:MAG: HD-GYP domain-containing protein [Candidatus Omnitrophica bacterium]|nr:HD-GYP domain-containing protein [Candidatus Omnitrophota bacterium]